MKNTTQIKSPSAVRWIVGTVLSAEIYAILRYCVFKGVSLTHWPLYVNNKAISLAGLVLLALTFQIVKRAPEADSAATRSFRQMLRRAGFALILIHVLMSLQLLRPGYFPQFFAIGEDKLNLVGESCLFLGVMSFACFAALAAAASAQPVHPDPRPAWAKARVLAWIGLIGAAGHVLIMGAPGWLTLETWPGWMPPITLLSFLAAVLPMLIKLSRGQRLLNARVRSIKDETASKLSSC